VTTPLVELRDITKSYGPVRSVDGIDLTLAPGEVLGLIGDNGAGKSTLMKVLAGAVRPDSGRIRVAGEGVDFASPADARDRHIDMVYQDLALCDTLDVAGNLFLGREPRKGPFIDRRRMHAQARALLGDLHVRVPSTRQPIANLSGGQRQSVAIARAVSFEPRVLIMDEPTAALAVAEVESVLALIRRVAHSGVGVVLITHRLQDLFEVCDRLQVMYEGRSVAERPIDELDLQQVVDLITGRTEADA
jgi:simple sugar transport system ATP-binding protein